MSICYGGDILTFEKANAYSPNWGQTIFQSANEMMNNNLLRERIEAHQAKASAERQWWDNRKTSIKEGFMKELDAEESDAKAESPSATTTSAPAPGAAGAAAAAGSGATTTNTPSSSASGIKTPESSDVPSTTGSDDDAVLVEAEGQQSGNTPKTGGGGGSGGGGGGKKKKKGKK